MNSKEKSDHDASTVAKFLTTDPAEIDKKVNEPIKKLLQEYSHIPQEKTVEHVLGLVRIYVYRQSLLRANRGRIPRIYDPRRSHS